MSYSQERPLREVYDFTLAKERNLWIQLNIPKLFECTIFEQGSPQHFVNGLSVEHMRAFEEIKNLYERCTQMDFKKCESLFSLAVMYYKIGDFVESVKFLNVLLPVPDWNVSKYILLSVIYSKQNNQKQSDTIRSKIGDVSEIFLRACLNGKYQNVECILECQEVSGKLNSQNFNNGIELASQQNHLEIVRLLLKDERVQSIDKALYLSCRHGHLIISEVLLNSRKLKCENLDFNNILKAILQHHHVGLLPTLLLKMVEKNIIIPNLVELACKYSCTDAIKYVFQKGCDFPPLSRQVEGTLQILTEREDIELLSLLMNPPFISNINPKDIIESLDVAILKKKNNKLLVKILCTAAVNLWKQSIGFLSQQRQQLQSQPQPQPQQVQPQPRPSPEDICSLLTPLKLMVLLVWTCSNNEEDLVISLLELRLQLQMILPCPPLTPLPLPPFSTLRKVEEVSNPTYDIPPSILVTCFERAVKRNHQNIANFLVQHYLESLKVPDSLLFNLIKLGHVEMAKLILETPVPLTTPIRPEKLLCLCCSRGYVDLAKIFLTMTPPNIRENKPILESSKNGHHEIVELLLKFSEVDPTVNNNQPLNSACLAGYERVVSLLLADKRVDPTFHNSIALQLACKEGNQGVVQLLLEDGRVDPNSAQALLNSLKHLELVKIWLKHPKILVNPQDSRFVMMAMSSGMLEVVQMLLADGRFLITQEILAFTVSFMDRSKNNVPKYHQLMQILMLLVLGGREVVDEVYREVCEQKFLSGLEDNLDHVSYLRYYSYDRPPDPTSDPGSTSDPTSKIVPKFDYFLLWCLENNHVNLFYGIFKKKKEHVEDVGANQNFLLRKSISSRKPIFTKILLEDSRVDPRSDGEGAGDDPLLMAYLLGDMFTVRLLLSHPLVLPNVRCNMLLGLAFMKGDLEFVSELLKMDLVSGGCGWLLSRYNRWSDRWKGEGGGVVEVVEGGFSLFDFPRDLFLKIICTRLRVAIEEGVHSASLK
eukprot:TRINITY_DN7648_c0_g1_i4.p1 TRINITY_DN7648_c0_g1~~TRINITY_DN7648_c0_g1_i4.p1  ORF type:complete len:991 (+),score=246.37 TRINITY_DN7648_c0_g1_i4:124-3096(+)